MVSLVYLPLLLLVVYNTRTLPRGFISSYQAPSFIIFPPVPDFLRDVVVRGRARTLAALFLNKWLLNICSVYYWFLNDLLWPPVKWRITTLFGIPKGKGGPDEKYVLYSFGRNKKTPFLFLIKSYRCCEAGNPLQVGRISPFSSWPANVRKARKNSGVMFCTKEPFVLLRVGTLHRFNICNNVVLLY